MTLIIASKVKNKIMFASDRYQGSPAEADWDLCPYSKCLKLDNQIIFGMAGDGFSSDVLLKFAEPQEYNKAADSYAILLDVLLPYFIKLLKQYCAVPLEPVPGQPAEDTGLSLLIAIKKDLYIVEIDKLEIQSVCPVLFPSAIGVASSEAKAVFNVLHNLQLKYSQQEELKLVMFAVMANKSFIEGPIDFTK